MTAQAAKAFETAASDQTAALFTLPVIAGAAALPSLGLAVNNSARLVLLAPHHAKQAFVMHQLMHDLCPPDKKHYLKDYDQAFFETNPIIGVVIGNRLIGQAVVHMNGKTACIQALSVHPAWSGHGLSGQLIASASSLAQSLGTTQLQARVKTDNKTGQAVFTGQGFTSAYEDKNEQDPRQSAYVYTKALPNAQPQAVYKRGMRGGHALWRG